MYYSRYPKYVSVSERRAKAEKKLEKLRKKNPKIRPVLVEGRTLAVSWWGKSWNNNLERYADYSNRIGRGRSYVRHGSVLDLQISVGQVNALVQGSRSTPYDVVIDIKKLSDDKWAAIRKACEGSFDSLSELISGKFPKSLKELFFKENAGLFPTPKEIKLDCSCPDWATMCKHVAASLYGVGTRLDDDPALFFTLRGIDIDDLISKTVADTTNRLLQKAEGQSENILEDADLGDVFGIQLDELDTSDPLPTEKDDSTRKKDKPKSLKGVAKKGKSKSAKRTEKKRNNRTPPRKPSPALGVDHNSNASSNRKATRKFGSAASQPQRGNMLSKLVTAIGRARKGKTVEQIQEKLDWTKSQIRNTANRASAKGLLEAVNPGVYRRKV